MRFLRAITIIILAFVVCFGAVKLGEVSYAFYKRILVLEERTESTTYKLALIDGIQNFQYNVDLFLLDSVKNNQDKIANNESEGKLNAYYISEQNNKLDKLFIVSKQLIDENKKPSYDYLKSVTVRIMGKDKEQRDMAWMGTGTVVKVTKYHTYILTNKHVAPKGAYIAILSENNDELATARVIANAKDVDLSLILVKGQLEGKQAIRGFGNITYQEKAYSVGMYLSCNYIYSEGTYAGSIQFSDEKRESMIINLPSAPGCSGSGVFNKHGEMIGVLYAGAMVNMFQSDTAKAICIKIEDVKEFLGENL